MRANEPVFSLNFDAPVTSLELSAPTSTLVLTYANNVSFHPVVPNSSPSHTLTLPHASSSASLHPTTGERFVAGSVGDPWVRVYGLEGGEERELYKGHHGPVHCVMYSPDGEMYASGSGEFLRLTLIFNTTFTASKLLTCSLCSFRGWDYPSVADKPWETVWLVARPTQWRLDRISTHRCGGHPLGGVPEALVYFTLFCSTITIMF